MSLLLGTRDGIYRAAPDAVEDAERVLAAGTVDAIAAGADRWFAATAAGAYRSAGRAATEWTDCGLPREPARSIAVGPGERVYAGTLPPALYVSPDGGDSWQELDGFRAIPSRGQWWNPDVTPHTRALAVDPGSDGDSESEGDGPDDGADRLLAGIDGGGFHVSADGGETWEERRGGIASFLHDVHVLGRGEYVAATDAGLFRTRDAGRWWDYLYGDAMTHRYFRGAFGRGATVYAGGARSHPPAWGGDRGADAALYRLDLSERDPDLTRVPYPGAPAEIVLCGAVDAERGTVLAGTDRGRVLRRAGEGDREDGWETLGTLPSETQIRCLQFC